MTRAISSGGALKGSAGFSLVELMVSLTILGFIMGALMGLVLSMQRGYVNQRESPFVGFRCRKVAVRL